MSEKAQKKTFTRWCNQYLGERMMKIENLYEDFEDGLFLINLLEIISSKRIHKYNKKPNMEIKKLENISKALKFIKKEGLKTVNIGAKDIYGGDKKLILGLIWTLILRYQINTGSDGVSPKKQLAGWVNDQIKSYDINVKDFSKTFSDGKVLCAITDSLKKGVIDLDNLSGDPIKDTQLAIDTALEEFQIPALIDAKDVVEHPDAHSMMAYLSYHRDYQVAEDNNYSKLAPSCENSFATGKGVEGGVDGRPISFIIHALDENGDPAKNSKYKADWDVRVTGPNGPIDCKTHDNNDGTLTSHYIPEGVGNYEVAIAIKNPSKDSPAEEIKGSVYKLEVKEGGDRSKSYAEGPGLTNAFDDQPAYFTVYVKDKNGKPVVGEEGLAIDDLIPKGASGDNIIVSSQKINDNKDGTYDVEYEVGEPGDYTMNVVIVGEPIKGMPSDLVVSPGTDSNQTYATGKGVKSPGFFGKNHPFIIHTLDANGSPGGAGTNDLKVTITSPNGESLPHELNDNGDGTYSGDYVPNQMGKWTVDAKMDKKGLLKGIKENPFTIQVKEPADPSKSYAEGEGILYAVDNRPGIFKVYAKDKNGVPVTGLTEGDWLGVKLTDPNTDSSGPLQTLFPVRITDNGDGSYNVEYDATKPGDYLLYVIIDDESIRDMPKNVKVMPGVDASHTEVTGPGVESGLPGSPLLFTVQAKDKYGNNVPVGGDDFQAMITGPDGQSVPCDLKDNGDGTYTGAYDPKQPGDYTVELTVNDDPNKLPYTCRVGAGSDADKSYCKGPGWDYAYDNELTEFVVHCNDINGEPILGESVKVTMIQVDDKIQKSFLQNLLSKVDKYVLQKKEKEDKKLQDEHAASRRERGLPSLEESEGDIPCEVTDNGDGTYKVEYFARIPGTYQASVQVGNNKTHVQKSPKNIIVRWRCPNPPCRYAQKCLCEELGEVNEANDVLRQELRKLGGDASINKLINDGKINGNAYEVTVPPPSKKAVLKKDSSTAPSQISVKAVPKFGLPNEEKDVIQRIQSTAKKNAVTFNGKTYDIFWYFDAGNFLFVNKTEADDCQVIFKFTIENEDPVNWDFILNHGEQVLRELMPKGSFKYTYSFIVKKTIERVPNEEKDVIQRLMSTAEKNAVTFNGKTYDIFWYHDAGNFLFVNETKADDCQVIFKFTTENEDPVNWDFILNHGEQVQREFKPKGSFKYTYSFIVKQSIESVPNEEKDVIQRLQSTAKKNAVTFNGKTYDIFWYYDAGNFLFVNETKADDCQVIIKFTTENEDPVNWDFKVNHGEQVQREFKPKGSFKYTYSFIVEKCLESVDDVPGMIRENAKKEQVGSLGIYYYYLQNGNNYLWLFDNEDSKGYKLTCNFKLTNVALDDEPEGAVSWTVELPTGAHIMRKMTRLIESKPFTFGLSMSIAGL